MANDITELQAIDFKLGEVIANSFDSLALSGPENYKEFLGRPIKEKIFRAEHEDAGGLARKISNAEQGKFIEPELIQKAPVLPVVGYFRKPGFSNGDDQARVMNKTVFDDRLLAAMKISVLPISLEYSMTFAAWDKLTLDKMQLAWYAYIVQHGRKNSRFMVPSLIGEDILEAPASFLDTKTVMFSNSSPEKSEVGRIYSVSTDFTINTQVIIGEAVSVPDEITVHGIATEYLTREWEGAGGTSTPFNTRD